MQLGAMNYRRKAKKSQDGLNTGFEFQTQNTSESLNRILGNKNTRNLNRKMQTMNPTQESANESGVFSSKNTDILLNLSQHRRDLSLSISNQAHRKRHQWIYI